MFKRKWLEGEGGVRRIGWKTQGCRERGRPQNDMPENLRDSAQTIARLGGLVENRMETRVLSAFLGPAGDTKDFRDIVKCLSACKEMAHTDVEKCLKEARFSKTDIDMGDGNQFTLYCKNIISVIRRQAELAFEDGDMHFRHCPNKSGERNVYEPMHTAFFGELYMLKGEKVMGSKKNRIVREDDSVSMQIHSVGFTRFSVTSHRPVWAALLL